ncbi:MAG: VOC family protein [Saprospiraceae bacterium]|nr:VOC family protein [Saprospiraceae bacterium]MCF8252542.1 VOC family protein [Saprospiraceae bacterium]MCF8282583.1 VOC family protein [Bacteroidales bacterium]MCF8310789.1 VOC family protein [Saprospiraceae bacterium]MCF8439381.1 VOC family protein [Saprospiraceae bacterium]
MKSAINWFEIPASNFDRAVDFYGKVLGTDLQKMAGPFDMAFFPCNEGGTGGCVTHGNGNKPSAEGSIVYLNGGDDLAVQLARVEPAGGKVVMPKSAIGENGFMAVFMDTEGNRVAFHSMN